MTCKTCKWWTQIVPDEYADECQRQIDRHREEARNGTFDDGSVIGADFHAEMAWTFECDLASGRCNRMPKLETMRHDYECGEYENRE